MQISLFNGTQKFLLKKPIRLIEFFAGYGSQMGVKDKDFENIAKNQSNASLYHLAGDSIVVNVLIAIFSKMMPKKEF